MTRHQYYYRPPVQETGGRSRPGVPPSTHTDQIDDNGVVTSTPNSTVVERMKDIQDDDDLRCGYKRMTAQIELQGFKINGKKVYRMMKENDLLLSRARAKRGPYVKHRCARPTAPLTLLEMDIKMFWVEEKKRHAYVLTIIDTFTRVALNWKVGYSMKWQAVKAAWEEVIENHLQPADMLAKELHIEVRSDNGPQFLASNLKDFFKENHLGQVFTHPYTPQENGHVESFHSIISRSLAYDRFYTLEQLENRLVLFYENYNNSRVHSATAMLPPQLFWKAWEAGQITTSKGKWDKLIFKLNVPRYLLKSTLKVEAESRRKATESKQNPQHRAPQAEAPKQQSVSCA